MYLFTLAQYHARFAGRRAVYATGNFLGVRTADALIRFHGRCALGMTVAVSHHAYGDSFDAGAASRGWRAWLGQALTPATVSPG